MGSILRSFKDYAILLLLSTAGGLLALALTPERLRWLHGLLASRNAELPDDAVADVAIVLGYALFKNGTPTEPLKGRVQAGLDAYLQGRARHLLFSGAHPGGVVARRSEANVMREYAEELMGGLPPRDRWFEEDASTSTYENALYSLIICRQKGWRSILLVTSPFHQIRSELVFRRLIERGNETTPQTPPDIQVYVARTAFVPHKGYGWYGGNRAVDLWDWARELLALVYYNAKGRL